MSRRYAFGRRRLTDRQIEVLMMFDRFRRRVAGRPTRPSFSEAALELGTTKAGFYWHIVSLLLKGYLTVHDNPSRPRNYTLSEKGVKWCRRKRRQVAVRRARKQKALTADNALS